MYQFIFSQTTTSEFCILKLATTAGSQNSTLGLITKQSPYNTNRQGVTPAKSEAMLLRDLRMNKNQQTCKPPTLPSQVPRSWLQNAAFRNSLTLLFCHSRSPLECKTRNEAVGFPTDLRHSRSQIS
jgi:hypothetical protein